MAFHIAIGFGGMIRKDQPVALGLTLFDQPIGGFDDAAPILDGFAGLGLAADLVEHQISFHEEREADPTRHGDRMLTVVADREEALIAHIPGRGEASAVRTRNPVLALIAQEYLHHDIVLQRAQLAIGFDEWDRWWQADPDLRTIILASQSE